MQIWCYRNSNTKSLFPTQYMWQSHFWAIQQIVLKTSQVASVPTNKDYTTSQSEAVWLTHKHPTNHCSFVLLLPSNSAVTFTLVDVAKWLNLSVIVSLFLKQSRHKDTSNLFGSQSVFAVCCSVYLAMCVNLQRSGQTVRQMCPVFTPVSSFTSKWVKTGCTEILAASTLHSV